MHKLFPGGAWGVLGTALVVIGVMFAANKVPAIKRVMGG